MLLSLNWLREFVPYEGDAATLARAFQPFYRGSGTVLAGKGLGLHVVERLGERLGWNVELRSSPGAGTTAIIRFAG